MPLNEWTPFPRPPALGVIAVTASSTPQLLDVQEVPGPAHSTWDDVHAYFKTHGVPHFSGDYRPNVPESRIVLLLVLTVAFQIGPAPWFLSPQQILLAPLFLLITGLLGTKLASRLHARVRIRQRINYTLPLLLLLVAALLFPLKDSSHPALRPEPWFDFLVLFSTLYTCALLLPPSVWSSDSTRVRFRAYVVAAVVAAFALLVLEGAAIPSLTTQANVVLGAISPHLVPVPQSLPGFVIADVLLLMSIHLSLGAAEPSKRLPLGTAPGGLRLIPLIPVMVIGVGAEAANLGNRFAGWRGPTAPLLLGIMLFAVCFMTLRLGSDGSMTARLSGLHMRFEDEVSIRRLSLWLAIYLLALPMWHTLAATDGMPGPDLPGALDALWVNLLYAVGAILFFGFGLHHIVWWAVRATFENRAEIARELVQGLPMLLAFAAFLLLTAELWEVTAELDRAHFTMLLGIVLVATLIPLGVLFSAQMKSSRFRRWNEVRTAIATCSRHEKLPNYEEMLSIAEGSGAAPGDAPPLTAVERMNATLVVVTYIAIIYGPLTVGSFALFLVIAHLAVPHAVAGEWVFGDGTAPTRGVELMMRPFFDQPWTRVALLLAVFSLLYLTVTVATNRDRRDELVAAASTALRERFAMRLTYRLATPDEVTR